MIDINSPKPTSKATPRAKTTPAGTATGRGFKNKPQDERWVLVPSGILVLLGAWMFAASASGQFSFTFIEPLAALLLVTLGLLCAWKIARRETIREYVRVIAWLLAILTTLASFLWLGDASGTCTGIMGTPTSCTDNNRVLITIFLLNPFSLTLWAALAASGIAGIFIKPRKP